MSEKFAIFNDIASQLKEIPTDSIVSKTLFKTDEIKATVFGFAPGQELTEHKVDRPVLLHFVTGEVELFLDGKRMVAQAGSWIRMDPGLAHSLKASEETIMLLLLITE